MRQIGMRTSWAAAVGAASVVLTACSAGSAQATTSTQPSIRGASLSGFACHSHRIGHSAKVTPSSVTKFRLCPLNVPEQQSRTVTVGRGNENFAALSSSLSAPDEPAYDGPCPMYADVPQRVIAQTSSGAVLVHIPVDGCGHYQRAATTALSNARGANAMILD